MKLFIWNNPYRLQFGGSIIYAVAASEDEARAVALRAGISQFGDKPFPNEFGTGPHRLDLGKPDRVIDAPCAEIYEWCE